MPVPSDDYSKPVPGYTEVIETAIRDWETQQDNPLTLPADERAVGSLALLITKRLVQAGLIDRSAKADGM